MVVSRTVSDVLDRHQKVRSILSRISYGKFLFWRLKVKAGNSPEELTTSKICMVNPETIEYCLSGKLPRHQYQTGHVPVLSGDWDLLDKRIEDLVENSTSNREDFQNANADSNGGQITVAIGRFGDFLLTDGLNILLKAKRLQVQQIPALISARHSQWQELRKEVYTLALEKRLYQPTTHPDLDMIAEHSCEDRFNMIRDNLSVKRGSSSARVLDIGANHGYFCQKFEELGFKCYAVENGLINLHYLRRFKRASNKKFEVVPEGIFKWKGVKELQFDVVLALNIFHHFLKRKKPYSQLIDLLNGLQVKEMFFEPHLPGEYQMKNAYKNYTEKEFVEFVLQNSKLKRAKPIGAANDGRTLYKLF